MANKNKLRAIRSIRLDDDILYAEEVIAKHLVCRVKTLQAWRHRGGGPTYIKIGRLVRYRGLDVNQWTAARSRRSTSEALPEDAA